MTGEADVDWVSNWATRFQPADGASAQDQADTDADSTGPRYRRAVSPLEWVFLGIGPERTVVNFLVEGIGELRAEDLAHAVSVASSANPGARLVRADTEWHDSGISPEVHVLDAADFGLESPRLHTGLADTGPTCEVVLVPGEPGTTVVFRAAHTVMDGKGVLLWAGDVFRVLRGAEPLGATAQLNNYQLLQHICAPADPPSATEPPAMQYPSPIGPRSSETAGLLWRRRSVDGTHLAATAKVTAALAARHGEGLFAIPVDLRRHAPELRSTAMLSQPLHLTVADGDGWEQVQHAMLAALADKQELGTGVDPGIMGLPLPVLTMGFADLDRQAADKDTYTGRAVVSHLGAVDLAELSTPDFVATGCYPLGGTNPGSPPELNLVETEGRTEITLAWYDGPGVAERADALLDIAVQALSPRASRDWPANRTQRALPSEHSVVRLFRDQVERTPDRIALSGPEGEVSYAELSRRADAVAAELRGRGVGPGTVVGLLAGRTVAAMAGLWGVLRTGACYLPLDVHHPDLRIAGLLGEAGADYCLVEAAHKDRDCVPNGCTPLPLDDLAASGATAPAADADIDPTSLAYVIYTSGSTGRPKGVQIEHRNLRNYAHWGIREYGLDEDIRLPLVTALSFDLSVTALFLPLLVGGRIVLLRDEPNHVSLRWLVEESGANALTLTPSHLDLIGRLDLRPQGYRCLIVVGEQLRTAVALRASELFGADCRLINLYGPTEATVGCTTHTFDPARDTEWAAVPIGVPGDNTTVFLLDEQRRFVEPGEVGEMYLGGAQLARGYLGRPDLDRDRFPTLADGTRVYRTGDLARLLPSGELECLGRTDDQVKIRGYRVEPAETARALEEHEAVGRAVVVARENAEGTGKALYGYVLATAPVTGPDLVDHLTERLPGYLVPSAVVVLPEFPYTVNGKIDTRALPDPFGTEHTASADSVALDSVQTAIAEIWAQTLGIELSRLDGQANFHRLGGDSLTLLAMIGAVSKTVLTPSAEEQLLAELPRLLNEPTLDHVAAIVRAAGTVLDTE